VPGLGLGLLVGHGLAGALLDALAGITKSTLPMTLQPTVLLQVLPKRARSGSPGKKKPEFN